MSTEVGIKEVASFLTRHIGFWAFIGSIFLTCLTLWAMFSLSNHSPVSWPEGSTVKLIITIGLVLTFWILVLGCILSFIRWILTKLTAIIKFRATKHKIQSLLSDEKQTLNWFVLNYYEPQQFHQNFPGIKSLKHKGLIKRVPALSWPGEDQFYYELSDSARAVLEKYPELVQLQTEH